MNTHLEYTRRTRKRISPARLPVEEAIAQGKAAFACGDYTAAIRLWEQALGDLSPDEACMSRLRSALAEALFRHALSLSDPDTSIDELLEAVYLAPDEPRYQYHLALAYHRNNIWPSAIPLYRALLERTPPYTRAAFPLAVALLETGDQPQADVVWQFLSPEEQTHLRAASALLSGHRKKDWLSLLSSEVHPFWAGLAAVRLKSPQAETYLTTALQDSTLPRQAAGIAHHYLGVLAWEDGRQAETLEHWQAAATAGIQTPWLSANLAWACAQSALAQLNTEESATLSEVLDLAEQGLRYVPDHLVLRQIVDYARQHLGYHAARKGDWKTARKYLWAAYQAGQRERALLVNLALTAEALGQYALAGGLWQQIARARPRKSTVEGFMSANQVARVWQRAAQCLSRAGDYREAARLYQNALRYAPQDASLHLERIATLFQDGRYATAFSAVGELLAQHPEHKEALTWRAHLWKKMGNPYGALDTWHRVLQLDPDHPAARQHIAQLSCQLGDQYLERNDLRQALIMYRGGLEVAPQDARLRAAVIRFYGLLGDTEKARKDAERLLRERPDDLEVYYWLMRTWVSLDKDDTVREYLRRVEVLQPSPSASFYITLGSECAKNGYNRWAKRFAEIAQRYPLIDVQGRLELAQIFWVTGESQQAIKCLERVIELAPDMAEAHLLLGMYLLSYTKAKQKAKKYLLQAELLARKTRNAAVVVQARRALSTLS